MAITHHIDLISNKNWFHGVTVDLGNDFMVVSSKGGVKRTMKGYYEPRCNGTIDFVFQHMLQPLVLWTSHAGEGIRIQYDKMIQSLLVMIIGIANFEILGLVANRSAVYGPVFVNNVRTLERFENCVHRIPIRDFLQISK
jgi:hypothetical protein